MLVVEVLILKSVGILMILAAAFLKVDTLVLLQVVVVLVIGVLA